MSKFSNLKTWLLISWSFIIFLLIFVNLNHIFHFQKSLKTKTIYFKEKEWEETFFEMKTIQSLASITNKELQWNHNLGMKIQWNHAIKNTLIYFCWKRKGDEYWLLVLLFYSWEKCVKDSKTDQSAFDIILLERKIMNTFWPL